MSLKAELQTWAAALKAYDEDNFEHSLDLFSQIADSSKILTNMGLIYATQGDHESAVERFIEATGLDHFLAVAYFQCGVSNFLLARYDRALKDFEEALLYLRGNQAINYEQLGLKFLLYSAEILFNKGLSQLYLGRTKEGMADMEEARREKATDEHNVIDDAINDRGEGYTVFSIPVGVLYRPSENKLKNAKAKDYLGKAKLIAASDSSDAYTTFTGVTRLEQGITPTGVFIDRPPDLDSPLSRSRSATLISSTRSDDKQAPRLKPAASNAVRQGSPPTPPMSAPVSRSNTLGRPSQNLPFGRPMRSLSVKNPNADSRTGGPLSAPAIRSSAGKERPMTDFYDSYLDSYTQESEPPLPALPSAGGASGGSAGGGGGGPNPERIAAWARSNVNPNNPPQRAPRSAPSSNYSPSSFGGGGGSLRRRLTRRTTTRSRAPVSMYEEEEEGYVSGEYEDGPFELVKIRVKLHYQGDVRGMALTPEMLFDEFIERVTTKFGKEPNGLGLKFKDEDGGKVTLRDESDYELAIETARESAKGKPEGKLEIWCTDV